MPFHLGDPLPPTDWDMEPAPATVPDMRALYVSEAPRLTRYFTQRLGAQDALDLVHEAFHRLFGAVIDRDPPIERPEAYLHRVASNLLHDRARSPGERAIHGRVELVEDQHPGPDPHPLLEHRDLLARIDAEIPNLKPKTREIFLLHRINGLSYAEIAERKGMSVKGVEYQIAKALAELRRRVRGR